MMDMSSILSRIGQLKSSFGGQKLNDMMPNMQGRIEMIRGIFGTPQGQPGRPAGAPAQQMPMMTKAPMQALPGKVDPSRISTLKNMFAR